MGRTWRRLSSNWARTSSKGIHDSLVTSLLIHGSLGAGTMDEVGRQLSYKPTGVKEAFNRQEPLQYISSRRALSSKFNGSKRRCLSSELGTNVLKRNPRFISQIPFYLWITGSCQNWMKFGDSFLRGIQQAGSPSTDFRRREHRDKIQWTEHGATFHRIGDERPQGNHDSLVRTLWIHGSLELS
ncbi:hypothetical protein CEXT_613251 [Caerostris extrusa]|uniref:Uncharacterized protein n=1 Tax=Caerostris extrusa TaxID=172846 RepID=A0AAV4NFF7_CAEEX|nr:hypothetical protein CEXT_613251 [Caerostris extrusa]